MYVKLCELKQTDCIYKKENIFFITSPRGLRDATHNADVNPWFQRDRTKSRDAVTFKLHRYLY